MSRLTTVFAVLSTLVLAAVILFRLQELNMEAILAGFAFGLLAVVPTALLLTLMILSRRQPQTPAPAQQPPSPPAQQPPSPPGIWFPHLPRIELRRLNDNNVLHFEPILLRNPGIQYRCREKPCLMMVHDTNSGWVINDQQGAVSGQPWNLPPNQHMFYPPGGQWVVVDNAVSHSYTLVYVP